MLALATVAWFFIGALLLFGMLVVVRSVFALVKEAKSLAGRVKDANERLGRAIEEVHRESEHAGERLEAVRARRPRRRR